MRIEREGKEVLPRGHLVMKSGKMSGDSIVPKSLFADDDGVPTETSGKQRATELDVSRFYKHYKAMEESQKWKLRQHKIVDSDVSHAHLIKPFPGRIVSSFDAELVQSLEFRVYREKTTSYLLNKSGLVQGKCHTVQSPQKLINSL